MSMWKRLMLTFLASGLGICLLSLTALMLVVPGASEHDEFHRALFHTRRLKGELNLAAQDTLAALLDIERKSGAFEAALSRADAEIALLRATHEEHAFEPAQRSLLQRIVSARTTLETESRAVMDRHLAGEPADPQLLRDYMRHVDDTYRILDELLAIEAEEVRVAHAAMDDSIHRAGVFLIVIGVTAVLGAMVLGSYAARRLTRPIRRLERAARQVSAGSLQPVPVDGTGEIAVLAEAFNRMIDDVSASRNLLERTVEERTADLQRTNDALRSSEERYRSLVERAPICIHEISCERRLSAMNQAGLDMVGGVHADDVLGAPYLSFVDDTDRERVAQLLEQAFEGSASSFEFKCLTPVGPRLFRSTFIPVRGSGDTVNKLVGTSEDITERRLAEQRQATLVRELDHRVKNNLAAVLSLAQQSAATAASLEEFRRSFTGRLETMARTHEAMARAHWSEMEIREVIAMAVSPFQDESGRRIRAEGPSARVEPGATMPLGLALHELATNAAKYGALSAVTGQVAISWTADGEHATELTWSESGGPEITTPAEEGFGLRLVRGFVEHEMNGRLELDFRSTGFVCRILLGKAGRPAPASNSIAMRATVRAAPPAAVDRR